MKLIFSFLFIAFCSNLFAQKDTSKAMTLDPSWILYYSHDLFPGIRFNTDKGKVENIIADYGITTGIQKRSAFNSKVGIRFGLNYVVNKIIIPPPSYFHPSSTVWVNGANAKAKYVNSNYLQIPVFLEYKFLKRKKIEMYSAFGMAVNFTIEGVVWETIHAEQNGKMVWSEINGNRNLSLYSPLHHNITIGLNYKISDKLKFNIEPICRIYSRTYHRVYYGSPTFGIGTNLIYRFK